MEQQFFRKFHSKLRSPPRKVETESRSAHTVSSESYFCFYVHTIMPHGEIVCLHVYSCLQAFFLLVNFNIIFLHITANDFHKV